MGGVNLPRQLLGCKIPRAPGAGAVVLQAARKKVLGALAWSLQGRLELLGVAALWS